MPSFSAVSATGSLPTRSSARMAGRLRDCWTASRASNGPRSSSSASFGAQPPPKSVEMSSSTLPGVRTFRSNAVVYTMALKADPG
jgi:hypothetical protein